MEFIKAFNERTANQPGYVVPAEITVFEDRSFTFVTKAPLAAALLKRAAGVEAGRREPNRDKVGKVSQRQLREIAETKMADLNANDVEHAMRIVGRHRAQHGHRGGRLMPSTARSTSRPPS